MINDPDLTEALLDSTVALIDCDSIEIELVRKTWNRTLSGGITQIVPVTLDPQRVFFGATVPDPRVMQSDNGEMIVASHVIVGLPGLDIEEHDEFDVGSRHYKVIDTHPDVSYEHRAWVIERA